MARYSGGHAALLPPAAHYVALLPSPEDATGKTFSAKKPGPHPFDVLRESEMRLSHDLESGKADRFVIELQIEPHGGGTLVDHAMDGDDRMAYQVRLRIQYAGGRNLQTLTTSKVGVISPANELRFPIGGQVQQLIDRFREEVREIEQKVNDKLVNAGQEPANWAYIREFQKGAKGLRHPAAMGIDVEAIGDVVAGFGGLTAGFIKPDDAIRDFLDNLEEFCRAIVDEMPRGSDLIQTFSPPAQRTLIEIQRIRNERSR